ncbi:MAG: hypothetical protein ABIO76_00805 [Ginsengibacter sp.]
MLFIAMSDGIRYLRPDGKKEEIIESGKVAANFHAKKIIIAFNSWGGTAPGTIDFLHRFFLPGSYSCNLSKLSYGFFGIKKDWKHFLDSLPYNKIYLHKDEVRKKYIPVDVPLPAILLSDSTHTTLLVNAAEISGVHNLDSLIALVKKKLE